MQTIRLRDADLKRANKIQFIVKDAGHGKVGRVGLSRVVRAALKFFWQEFERNEEAGVQAVLAVGEEE